MMRTVHLHGALKKHFGAAFLFDVATAAEALRALNCAFPRRFVAELELGSYEIVRGRRHGGMVLDLDLVCHLQLGGADLHIIPVAAGSKNSGAAVKAIAGVALIGTAIFMSGGTLAAPLAQMGAAVLPGVGGLTWGSIATLGLGLTLAGAASMMAKAETAKNEADTKSFTFNGPINTNEQGNARPLVYGEVITGGQPISSGFDVEEIGVYQ